MKPVEIAAMVYEKEPCARSFKEDLEAHLLDPHGIVVSTPSCFLMARPVLHWHEYRYVTNPHIRYHNGDCWHVYLYAGEMMSAFKQATYRLPFVSFERKNRLRVYTWQDIYAACSKHCTPSFRTS